MKREGRQHGMVRSCMVPPPPWNHRPKSKVVNEFTSRPTAGIYTKVRAKPTNHSKFTGNCRRPRCIGCHSRPARKSRDKAKGTHKLQSCDVALNHRLISWRVVDKGLGLNCAGQSASGMLRHLSEDHWDEVDEEMEDDLDCGADDPSATLADEEVGRGGTEIDGGDMDFNEVGFVWEFVDDHEDWCLVGEV